MQVTKEIWIRQNLPSKKEVEDTILNLKKK